MSSWPSLISTILVAYNFDSNWPCRFLHPGCFWFCIYIRNYTFPSYTFLRDVLIAVAQLSINGTNVTSVTDRTNEPQYHVKEDEGSITFCLRLESFPEEKDSLTIIYSTTEGTACKSTCGYVCQIWYDFSAISI